MISKTNRSRQVERHFVAYHNGEERGSWLADRNVKQGEEPSFVTAKPFRAETLKGQRLWAFEGSGSPRQYRLVASGIITRLTKWKRPPGYREPGREYGIRVHFKVDVSREAVEVTGLPWFQTLLDQQQSFRNGFNRLSDINIIRSLKRLPRERRRSSNGESKRQSSSPASMAELRRSPSAANKIVRQFAPKDQLEGVPRAVAHSIQCADRATHSKWGLRLNRSSIMLKVGFVEVLQLGKGWFHQLVEKQLVPAKWRTDPRLRFHDTGYVNAPGSGTCDVVDIAVAASVYAALRRAHEAAIRIAARSRIHTSTINDHSPGLIEFLSRELGIYLPQPAYVEAHTSGAVCIPEEIPTDQAFEEGAAIQVLVNRYERDPAARQQCIDRYGVNCFACGLSLGDLYGPEVNGLIHVHHLTALAAGGTRSSVPVRDLRPVCPNCHAVIHSTKPPRTIERVRKMIRQRSSRPSGARSTTMRG
jgi:hypothetical protein